MRRLEQNEIKNEMLTAIARLTYPQPEPAPPDTVTIGDGGDGEPGGTAQCAENAVEYVVQTRIQVPFFKPALESEQDVEAYVAALKKAYLAAIRDRKRITISQ